MSLPLINRNPDLKRLQDEGFEVDVIAGHLLVHSVPYVNSRREVVRGTLVSELTLAGEMTTTPSTHVAYFAGEHPCTKDGQEIVQIKHQSQYTRLAGAIEVNHAFSNKPPGGYPNYYEKMARYIQIISDPAKAIDPMADARTFKPIEATGDESVFEYTDTASSRAGIQALSEKLACRKVAIVGLGGTGSYILDFIAKTPVQEIHLFDDDLFLQHNAFRAPGAPSLEVLRQKPTKVGYLSEIYSRMRAGIVPHRERVTASNVSSLFDCDFVFVCVDSGEARRTVLQALQRQGVPFIDVGMGVEMVGDEEGLLAVCRITAATKSKGDHVARRVPFGDAKDDRGGIYAQNIQVADLNALNAIMAIIKWKQICGFYQDVDQYHHVTYSTNINLLAGEEEPA